MTSSTPDTTGPTPGTGWTVTGQMEQQKLDGAGNFTDGITVTFQTQYGHQGSVFVPRNQFTPEVVRQAIISQARTMDQVAALGAGY